MTKVLYDSKFLQLKSTDSQNGDIWFYAHRPNAENVVIVLPVTQDEILFLIEERPPMLAEHKGKYSVGLPAGLVGDERINETTEDAIKAELLEEAGLRAEEIKIVAEKVASSTGCLSETCTIAIAYIKDKTIVSQPIDDGGIIVDRIWIRKNDVYEWLRRMEQDGYILSAHTLAALYYLNEQEKIL